MKLERRTPSASAAVARRLLCAAAGCDSGVTTQLVTEGALPIESRRRALAEAYRAAFEKALGGALAEAQRRLALE